MLQPPNHRKDTKAASISWDESRVVPKIGSFQTDEDGDEIVATDRGGKKFDELWLPSS